MSPDEIPGIVNVATFTALLVLDIAGQEGLRTQDHSLSSIGLNRQSRNKKNQ